MYHRRTSPDAVAATAGNPDCSCGFETATGADHVSPPSSDVDTNVRWRVPGRSAPSYAKYSLPSSSAATELCPM